MEELLGNGIALAVVGLIIWSLWRAGQPVPYFAVRITNGEPQLTTGTATPAFLRRVREIVSENGITTGRVWGVARRGGHISLKFSGHFTPSARQQLRNWWAASGWSATKRRN